MATCDYLSIYQSSDVCFFQQVKLMVRKRILMFKLEDSCIFYKCVRSILIKTIQVDFILNVWLLKVRIWMTYVIYVYIGLSWSRERLRRQSRCHDRCYKRKWSRVLCHSIQGGHSCNVGFLFRYYLSYNNIYQPNFNLAYWLL